MISQTKVHTIRCHLLPSGCDPRIVISLWRNSRNVLETSFCETIMECSTRGVPNLMVYHQKMWPHLGLGDHGVFVAGFESLYGGLPRRDPSSPLSQSCLGEITQCIASQTRVPWAHMEEPSTSWLRPQRCDERQGSRCAALAVFLPLGSQPGGSPAI